MFDFTVAACDVELFLPLDGQVLAKPNPPILSWRSVYGAKYVKVHVCTEPLFTSPVEYSLSNFETSVTLGASLPKGVYYWRVKVSVDNVVWSDWSGVRSFRLGIVEPLGVKSYATSTGFKVTWLPSADLDTVGYRIYYTNASYETWKHVDVGNVIFAEVSGMFPDLPCYIRVAALEVGNLAGEGSFTESVVIGETAPVNIFQVAQGNEVEYVWDVKPNALEYYLQMDSAPTFSTGNLLSYTIDEADMNVEASFVHTFPAQRRNEQVWYYRLGYKKENNEISQWSTQKVVPIEMNGFRTVQAHTGNWVASTVVVKKLDGSGNYALATDYTVDSYNKITRVVSGSIAEGATVLVCFDAKEFVTIAEEPQRMFRNSLNDALPDYYYDRGSRNSDIYRLQDIYAKEFLGLNVEGKALGTLPTLQGIDKRRLHQIYNTLVGLQGEVGFPLSWAVIKCLTKAFQYGGTKQGMRLGVKAITGTVPELRKAPEGWVLGAQAVPELDEYYWNMQAGVVTPVPEDREISILSKAAAEEDWFIDVYNATIKTNTQINLLGAAQYLGRKDILESSVWLEDPAGNVISPALYVVDGVSGVLTWVGTTPSILYYAASYRYWAKDLITRIVNLLAPAYIKPIINWLDPETPLYPSSEWGLAVWGLSTWGAPL